MVWNLKIYHLDIAQGDSTLIVAHNDGVGLNQSPQTRAVLIDGGLLGEANGIHTYVTTAAPGGAGLNAVDVIVSTHYDKDHLNGLRGLLGLNVATYDNAIIFDQGEQGKVTARRGRGNAPDIISYSNQEQDYIQYLTAIASRGARSRVTARVYNDADGTNILNVNGWNGPDWLVGREIMWTTPTGVASTPAAILNPNGAANINLNQPTITCLAANQYIQGAPANPYTSGQGVDPRNEKSLAFLVRFNNFKYYIGGDIEGTQEAQLQNVLNPTNNAAGRVLVMKVSHHGSDRSTRAAFLTRLRPLAAVISCGYNNRFGRDAFGTAIRLPRDSVLANLQGCATLTHYYMTEDREQDTFDARVGQITNNDTTNANGANVAGNIATAYTAKAVVAGGWNEAPYLYPPPAPGTRYGDIAPNRRMGHVIVEVTEAESQQAVSGVLGMGQTRFHVRGYSATATARGPFNDPY